MEESITDQAENLIEEGEKAVKAVAYSPWVETITRIGFGARGLIYAIMGLLTLQVAFGTRGSTADQKQVIQLLADQPLGELMLLVILVGLLGYSLWGLIKAILDPFQHGKDLQGLLARIGYLSSAISYGTLVVPTLYIIVAPGSPPVTETSDDWRVLVARILAVPWGRWVVTIAGLIGLGAGLFHFYQALKPGFERHFHPYELTQSQIAWAKRLGRFGVFARAVVFFLVGVFLVQAGLFVDSSRVHGIDEAIMELAYQPYGFWWLLVIGLGLISFGIYSSFSAIFFRFKKTHS